MHLAPLFNASRLFIKLEIKSPNMDKKASKNENLIFMPNMGPIRLVTKRLEKSPRHVLCVPNIGLLSKKLLLKSIGKENLSLKRCLATIGLVFAIPKRINKTMSVFRLRTTVL